MFSYEIISKECFGNMWYGYVITENGKRCNMELAYNHRSEASARAAAIENADYLNKRFAK